MPRTDAMDKRAQVRESTRQLLISAATELLRERGTAGLTMTAVARRADVAVRTVYNHFASVDKLTAATMAGVTTRFAALLHTKVDLRGAGPEETLHEFVHKWFAELAKSDARMDALMSVRGSADLDDALALARDLRLRSLRDVLAKADQAGTLRVTLEQAVAMAYVVTGYQSWVALVPQLGFSTAEAADLVAGWVVTFAFCPDARLDLRTSQPGGRGGAHSVGEESPDSAGQGGG